MLLKITSNCTMGCSHCLDNCTKDGKHMTKEVFENVLQFLIDIKPNVLLITGGEPTGHPDFFYIMERLLQHFDKRCILLTTNGLFLYDKIFTEKVLALGVCIQVTNDIRYYPLSINMDTKHERIEYETNIRAIYPMGRAITNNIKPYGINSPWCFNLRSIGCHNASSFREAIAIMESRGKFCTPCITVDGNVLPGEGSSCFTIGNVKSSDAELLHGLKTMSCNFCGMEDNLPPHYRMYINSNVK